MLHQVVTMLFFIFQNHDLNKRYTFFKAPPLFDIKGKGDGYMRAKLGVRLPWKQENHITLFFNHNK